MLKAELAGMDPDDIQIEVEDNVLTLKGERKFEETVDEERYYRVERRYGSFQRSLALPQGVKADEIQAGLRRRHPHGHRTEGRGGEAQEDRGQGQEGGRDTGGRLRTGGAAAGDGRGAPGRRSPRAAQTRRTQTTCAGAAQRSTAASPATTTERPRT